VDNSGLNNQHDVRQNDGVWNALRATMSRFNYSLIRYVGCLCAVSTLMAASQTSAAQSYPPVWSNTSKYAAGDMVTDYGNVYRCIKVVTTPYLDPSKTFANWELNEVRNNTTLTIGTGQTFPTLTAAWTNALNCRVAQGVYLHLSIVTTKGDFTENFTSAFSLDHGSAAGISIIGDQTANINLNFPNTNGFTIDSGCTFGALENYTLTQNPEANEQGVSLSQNSTITLVNNISFVGSTDPIYADTGSNVTGGSGLQFTSFSGAGAIVTATNGATATMNGLNITGQFIGPGILAQLGGHIIAQGAEVSEFAYGAEATEGGVIDLTNANISHCDYGVFAVMKGHVCAVSANFTNDQYGDIWADTGATVDASYAGYSGNSGAHTANGGYIFTQND
jgi:hypothetical protein